MDLANFILPKLENLNLLGYWLVFLISFSESIAFIGLLIPGTVLIFLIGFLSANGWLDIGDLIWFAAAGVFLADLLSYFLGKRGCEYFSENNKIFKPSYLKKGEDFFIRHGVKSIFLGKFVGPLRPIIPFIAGLSSMNFKLFIFFELLVSVIWAAAYLLLGYFFGQAWHLVELWTSRAGIFIFLLFISFLIFYALRWLAIKKGRQAIESTKNIANYIFRPIFQNRCWRLFLSNHPRLVDFVKKRFDYTDFFGLTWTFLLIVFLVVGVFLFGIGDRLINADIFSASDINIGNLFYAFRNPILVKIFSWVTILGSEVFLAIITVGVALIFYLWRYYRYILPLLLASSGSALFTILAKYLVHRPRPEASFFIEPTYSFPSGHTAVSTVVYGFLAYFCWRNSVSWKAKINFLSAAVLLICSIAFSRLYLGAHYLSDILGGLLLGSLWLIIGISFSEWLSTRVWTFSPRIISVKARKFFSILFFLFFLFYYFYISAYSQPERKIFIPQQTGRKIIVEEVEDLWQIYRLPKQIENYNGKKQKPLNFMIIADDNQALVGVMNRVGWLIPDKLDFKALVRLIKAVGLNERYATAPMSAAFWNNQVNSFAFEKPDSFGNKKARRQARFWLSDFITPEGKKIYFGSINFDSRKKFSLFHQLHPDIDAEREDFFQKLLQSQVIGYYQKIGLVDPVKPGGGYYTDGKLYLVELKDRKDWPIFL